MRRKRRGWGFQLLSAVVLTLISVLALISGRIYDSGLAVFFILFLAGHSWYKFFKLFPKSK